MLDAAYYVCNGALKLADNVLIPTLFLLTRGYWQGDDCGFPITPGSFQTAWSAKSNGAILMGYDKQKTKRTKSARYHFQNG